MVSGAAEAPAFVIEGCTFCDIAAGDLPAEIVARTEHAVAFRDINPAAPVHVLIIPADHVADSAAQLTTDHGPLLGEVFDLAARVARAEGLDDGWRLVTNAGPEAGQTVFHLHFHLMGGWGRSRRTAPRLADERGG